MGSQGAATLLIRCWKAPSSDSCNCDISQDEALRQADGRLHANISQLNQLNWPCVHTEQQQTVF